MSKLEKLRKSILTMSHEEQLEALRRIREDRKQNKMPAIKERKARESTSALDKLVEGLTPEQAAELLRALSGEAR